MIPENKSPVTSWLIFVFTLGEINNLEPCFIVSSNLFKVLLPVAPVPNRLSKKVCTSPGVNEP